MRGSLRAVLHATGLHLGWLLCAAALGAGPAVAEPMRIAIVLDDSGSMLTTDPERLSITAAMIAVELARPEDQVTLVPLNGRRSPAFPGGPRSPLLALLTAMQRRGAETIYDRPLEAGLRAVASGPGRRTVLFLTDGEPSSRSGAKADEDRLREAQERYLVKLAARDPGARIYAVALGDAVPGAWYGLFTRAASRSGGSAFRVQDPAALVDVFAEVYARGLGSRVVRRELGPGRSTVARIDPLARFANLVLIAKERAAFTVRFPGGGGGGASRSSGLDLRPAKSVAPRQAHHFLDRLPPSRLPASGELEVELTGQGGYRALLIWDYGLSLELDPPERQTGGGYALRAWFRDLEKNAADPRPELHRALEVQARICPGACDGSPTGCRPAARLGADCSATGCQLRGVLELPAPGRYCVDAVARRALAGTRLLELASRQRHPLEAGAAADLRAASHPLRFQFDQNQAPARWRDCKPLRIEAAGLAAPVSLQLDVSRLRLPRGVALAPAPGAPLRLAPDRPLQVELCLGASQLVPRPGFRVERGELLARSTAPVWFASGRSEIPIPVEITITPRTFWNQYKRLLALLLGALLALLFLVWLIAGFVRPHPFPENLKVNWGKSLDRLDRNEMPVSEIPQAKRGFYRNAQLWLGGRRCFVGSGGAAQGRFEATGPSSISVFAEGGTALERVNKLDPDRRTPLAAGSPVSLGDVVKLGELYLRLKL